MLMHMLSSALLLSTAGPGAGVTLHLTAINDSVLVGEPLRVDLRWHTLRRQFLPATPYRYTSYSGITIVIEHEGKAREYREAFSMIVDEMTTTPPAPAGADVHWDLLLHHGYYEPFNPSAEPELAFAEAGKWRVQVRYGPASSNWVSVAVAAPAGDDEVVLETLSEDLFALKHGGPSAEALLARHPKSRYLLPARVSRAEREVHQLQTGHDILSGRPLPARDSEETRREWRQLGAELQQGSWGVYEEERLTLMVLSAQAAGDNELARQTLERLQGSYPHSPSARVLADKLGPEGKEPRY
jgi:hypothetical protein